MREAKTANDRDAVFRLPAPAACAARYRAVATDLARKLVERQAGARLDRLAHRRPAESEPRDAARAPARV